LGGGVGGGGGNNIQNIRKRKRIGKHLPSGFGVWGLGFIRLSLKNNLKLVFNVGGGVMVVAMK